MFKIGVFLILIIIHEYGKKINKQRTRMSLKSQKFETTNEHGYTDGIFRKHGWTRIHGWDFSKTRMDTDTHGWDWRRMRGGEKCEGQKHGHT